MLILTVPDSSYTNTNVPLAGKTYKFNYRYNFTTERWMLDIYLNETPVILGQSIIENSYMFYGRPIENFDHGVLGCFAIRKGVTEKAGRYNIGIDRDYWFAYIPNSELEL